MMSKSNHFCFLLSIQFKQSKDAIINNIMFITILSDYQQLQKIFSIICCISVQSHSTADEKSSPSIIFHICIILFYILKESSGPSYAE